MRVCHIMQWSSSSTAGPNQIAIIISTSSFFSFSFSSFFGLALVLLFPSKDHFSDYFFRLSFCTQKTRFFRHPREMATRWQGSGLKPLWVSLSFKPNMRDPQRWDLWTRLEIKTIRKEEGDSLRFLIPRFYFDAWMDIKQLNFAPRRDNS